MAIHHAVVVAWKKVASKVVTRAYSSLVILTLSSLLILHCEDIATIATEKHFYRVPCMAY